MAAHDLYENVLGQKVIEEWQSGEGQRNVFATNTSLEAVTMKNVFDCGVTANHRGRPTKTKTGDKILKVTDYALDDRALVILANGFHVCSSLRNRCIIFHIPDLVIPVSPREEKTIIDNLEENHTPHIFSVIRYFISEEFNRQHLSMTPKILDGDEDLDAYEFDLTISRIHSVMDEMGFITNDILTNRMKTMIRYFAQTLAQWRAVLEVFGSFHYDCKMEAMLPEESFAEFTDRNIGTMTSHLKKLTEYERLTRQSSRVVMDPSDILSAATLLVELTEPDRQLLNVLCSYMADPSECENVEGVRDEYLVIRNINLNTICDELKKRKMKVLDESLSGLVMKLEKKLTGTKCATIVMRKIEATAYSRSRETKMFHSFDMFIHAESAATLYAQEHTQIMEECVEHLARHMYDVVRNGTVCEWNGLPSQNMFTSHYIKLHDVPAKLRKAFVFVYHLPGQRKKVSAATLRGKGGSYMVEVSPDFGKAHLRVLRRLVTECISSNTSPSFDDDGYIELDAANTEVYSRAAEDTVASWCDGWEENPLLVVKADDKWLAHLAIFSKQYDSNGTVMMWRKIVIDHCLTAKDYSRRGYFSVPSSHVNNVEAVPTRHSCHFGNTLTLFKRDEESKRLKAHMTILEGIARMDGIVEEKPNLAKDLVERCLCKDMTDFRTVMVFDREKVYKTQDVLDSICFVNVQDVAFRHPDRQLPVFSVTSKGAKCTTELSNFVRTANHQDADAEGTTETFRQHHRQRKLAVMHLIACHQKWKVKINKMREGENDLGYHDLNELEKKIDEMVEAKEMETMYTPLKKTERLHPFPQPLRHRETRRGGQKRRREVVRDHDKTSTHPKRQKLRGEEKDAE